MMDGPTCGDNDRWQEEGASDDKEKEYLQAMSRGKEEEEDDDDDDEWQGVEVRDTTMTMNDYTPPALSLISNCLWGRL